MDAQIKVEIRNKYGEPEQKKTFYAASFSAASRKANKWIGTETLRDEKDGLVIIDRNRVEDWAWYIVWGKEYVAKKKEKAEFDARLNS